MFRANIENCEAPKYEKIIDGYFEFLFVDKNGNPVVAMNWHHRLNHMGEAIQSRSLSPIFRCLTTI